MTNDDITGLLLAIPEISAWPQMATILTRTAGKVRMDWLLPVFGCQAVGGAEPDALPGVAAMACSQISIILADDLLDEDPRGEHHRIGVGQAANLALAFQAAAFRVIDQAPISAAQRAAVQGRLAFLALKTAYGQWLDVQNLSGEDDYWKVVEAKSTPFYGVALQVEHSWAAPVLNSRLKSMRLACNWVRLSSYLTISKTRCKFLPRPIGRRDAITSSSSMHASRRMSSAMRLSRCCPVLPNRASCRRRSKS